MGSYIECQDCLIQTYELKVWNEVYNPPSPYIISRVICHTCFKKRETARLEALEETAFLNGISSHPRFQKKPEEIKEKQPGFLTRIVNKVFKSKSKPKSGFRIIPIK